MLRRLARKLPDTTKKLLRRIVNNKLFLPFYLRAGKPISDYYGLDRGTPVDRFFIERFLAEHTTYIKGNVLELLNDHYTKRFGGKEVTKSDILDIDALNKEATIIGDLRNLKEVANETYDCIILTQVLQFIDDTDAALKECHRILKPGGVLLATVPALSRIDCVSGDTGDFWRFTAAGAQFLFAKYFKDVITKNEGNASIGVYFLLGLAQEDVSSSIFAKHDGAFPVVVTIFAKKS